eukprot:6289294-Alexandrium_andersonii.AAC.1
MSASLVGSEMCIRDSHCLHAILAEPAYAEPILAGAGQLAWCAMRRASSGSLQSAEAVRRDTLFV